MESPFDTSTTNKENKNMDNTNTPDGVSLTYKGGAGFDAPWIVIRSETVAGALELANDPALKELMSVVQAGGQHFAGLAKPINTAGGRAPRQGQPAGSTSVELSDADWAKVEGRFGSREIPNGWEVRSGVSKSNGRTWKGVMPPRGSEDKPLFL